jgi:hypothetical protein
MTSTIQLTLEIGPRGKRVVAVAPDWPGLSRGASTAADAIERLRMYLPRYAPVVAHAGLTAEFDPNAELEVVEEYPGTGSTDFWGISFAFSEIDHQERSRAELDRSIALMQGSWAFFDDVRARVSTEMKRGPRGGGRDRDQIVNHTLGAERQQFAPKLGVLTPPGVLLTDDGLKRHREAYCAALRELHAEGKMARKWPLTYLIRHTAFHTLDHAWEMEDKDLSNQGA